MSKKKHCRQLQSSLKTIKMDHLINHTHTQFKTCQYFYMIMILILFKHILYVCGDFLGCNWWTLPKFQKK